MMIRSTKQVFRGTAGGQDINYHKHDGHDKQNNLLNSISIQMYRKIGNTEQSQSDEIVREY